MTNPDPSEILVRQRAAFMAAPAPDAATRRGDLARLRAAILTRRKAFEAAVAADFGRRAAAETALLELLPTVSTLDHMSRRLARWMKPERRPVALTFRPGRARVIWQPVGVVGVISPWNYPVSLSLTPLATALAAGNRVMLKPSEFTPRTSALLGEMLADTFPPEQVAVVKGGADVAAAFSALPFDHLVFTGGTETGRRVMAAAAGALVPVTLELGGKSPVIIAPGHAGERTAQSVIWGKLANAGQTCIAPDYVLLTPGDLDGFIAACTAAVRRFYPGGAVRHPDYAAIARPSDHARLSAMVEDARAAGARILPLGETAGDPPPGVLPPVLVLDAPADCRLMREEIFGPVLPIITVPDLTTAIAHVNARPRPLALYVFGDDDAAETVMARTTSGNVTVNDTLLHYAQDDLPFGGVGDSGIGAYHGVEGFRRFSHAKGVFVQSRWSATGMSRPPYGRRVRQLLKVLLR